MPALYAPYWLTRRSSGPTTPVDGATHRERALVDAASHRRNYRRLLGYFNDPDIEDCRYRITTRGSGTGARLIGERSATTPTRWRRRRARQPHRRLLGIERDPDIEEHIERHPIHATAGGHRTNYRRLLGYRNDPDIENCGQESAGALFTNGSTLSNEPQWGRITTRWRRRGARLIRDRPTTRRRRASQPHRRLLGFERDPDIKERIDIDAIHATAFGHRRIYRGLLGYSNDPDIHASILVATASNRQKYRGLLGHDNDPDNRSCGGRIRWRRR